MKRAGRIIVWAVAAAFALAGVGAALTGDWEAALSWALILGWFLAYLAAASRARALAAENRKLRRGHASAFEAGVAFARRHDRGGS